MNSMSIFSTKRKNIPSLSDLCDSVFLHIMASMPFGMHAAQKVRANMNLSSPNITKEENWKRDFSSSHFKFNTDHNINSSPSKYCDKMMNSIWGLYNQYSVHNFKSNTSSGQAQSSMLQQPAIKESQDLLRFAISCPLDGMKFNL